MYTSPDIRIFARFGPCHGKSAEDPFVFDFETLELYRRGIPLPLELRPATVLAYLLERRGRTVTRTELFNLLWPGESHGDHRHRLDCVINKLRSRLRDPISRPQFIQTLNRRGYRFIGIMQPKEAAGAVHDRPLLQSTDSTASGETKQRHILDLLSSFNPL
jgi:DNA-binding winged helix-turn-helix (wHTH) protein